MDSGASKKDGSNKPEGHEDGDRPPDQNASGGSQQGAPGGFAGWKKAASGEKFSGEGPENRSEKDSWQAEEDASHGSQKSSKGPPVAGAKAPCPHGSGEKICGEAEKGQDQDAGEGPRSEAGLSRKGKIVEE